MVGWHHRLDGHEFEQAPGVGDGQGSMVCCGPWDCKESDTTEWLNWTCVRLGICCCGYTDGGGTVKKLMVQMGSRAQRRDSWDVCAEFEVWGVWGAQGRFPHSPGAWVGETACAKSERWERAWDFKESFDSLAMFVACTCVQSVRRWGWRRRNVPGLDEPGNCEEEPLRCFKQGRKITRLINLRAPSRSCSLWESCQPFRDCLSSSEPPHPVLCPFPGVHGDGGPTSSDWWSQSVMTCSPNSGWLCKAVQFHPTVGLRKAVLEPLCSSTSSSA